mmetsp:Transcript_32703/g.56904  ORF Transcript_32703/g.56904 Transcript_32703/m.56904 type:complete len:179 (+) Transcript_32703:1060-1596(+)
MEELLLKTLQQREDRIKLYGVHVLGLANLALCLPLQPLFVMSSQLQFTGKPALPNFSGTTFQDKLGSYIYMKHSANRPFKAPQFANYQAAYFENTLSGYKSFYRGTWSGALAFYFSTIAKSFFVKFVPEDFSSKLLAEVITSCCGADCATTIRGPISHDAAEQLEEYEDLQRTHRYLC